MSGDSFSNPPREGEPSETGPDPHDVAPLPAVPPPSLGADAVAWVQDGARPAGSPDPEPDDAQHVVWPTATEPMPRVSLLRQVTAAQLSIVPEAAPGAAPSSSSEAQPGAAGPDTGTAATPPLPGPVSALTARPDAAGKMASTSPYVFSPGTAAVPQQAHPQAGRLLRRLLEREDPPTVTFNIVDRLVGSPYANPTVAHEPESADELARPVLLFALDLAETMIRWGAGALEVETSVIAVTASLGLRHVDVDITNQSAHLNYAPPEGMPVSILRVVRSSSDNYAGLTLVHQMVADITAGRVQLDAARVRLRSIRRRPKPYPKWAVLLAGAAFAGLFVLIIGGTPNGAVAALGSSLLVTAVGRVLDRWNVPRFFSVAAGMVVATVAAMLLFQVGWLNSPELVVAGGMMLLLPSGRFVSAAQDGIYGFPVTALGRLFSALITYAAIIAGVLIGAEAAVSLGMRPLDLAKATSPPTLPLVVLCALVVLAVSCGAVVQQVAPAHVAVTAGVSLVGYLVLTGFSAIWGHSPRLAPAVSAVVMGLLARWIGLRIGTTALVLAVPAIVILLPGLAIFRAIYAMADTSNITGGLVQMFNAFTIVLGIAAGVALGDTLARPFTRDWNARERRRIRRR